MNNQNNKEKISEGYLCEGGEYCEHGSDSTHWVDKDEFIVENDTKELDIDDQKTENLSDLENLVSIESELESNKFDYVILNPRAQENPEYDLGIEITIPKLAKDGIENIDPQHGDNPNLETSAIEEALNFNIENLPENAKIATIRPDTDSIGAMAVLELRKANIEPDKDLIRYIGKFDSYGFKRAKEICPEIEVRSAEITAASQNCLNRTDSIENKVIWMKKLLTGRAEWSEIEAINQDWEKQKEIAKQALIIEPIVEDKAILITGNHPQAFAIGYEQAGIVAAYNPEFSRPWVENDKPCEKWTIGRYSEAEPINIAQLKRKLNELEKQYSGDVYDPTKTWGGPANLVASPQGYTSSISKENIIETIKTSMINTKKETNTEQETNPRIKKIKQEISSLQKEAKTIKQDLEKRKNDRGFQGAQKLFEQGYRLYGWDEILTDTDNQTVLEKNGKQIGYWADGTGRNTDEAFSLAGLALVPYNTNENLENTMHYLCDLTEEESLKSDTTDKENFRACTCGSGLDWFECQKKNNTSYCG